ncbi:hypothetical protein L5515_000938 [Caenorhabditis briggsae]|uniref:Uncharacterized protein n=1 Tax=Caenorhabditis briggsae TaxID=6238 RepID=A0AAE9E1I0_CAEBR|nr:hypothetical protein L5515_000938 [Caenorhabditis briggsae]
MRCPMSRDKRDGVDVLFSEHRKLDFFQHLFLSDVTNLWLFSLSCPDLHDCHVTDPYLDGYKRKQNQPKDQLFPLESSHTLLSPKSTVTPILYHGSESQEVLYGSTEGSNPSYFSVQRHGDRQSKGLQGACTVQERYLS